MAAAPTLEEVRKTPHLLCRLCTKLVSIRDLIGSSAKLIVCPFHMDTDPSAKYHDDPDGVRLWCFGCNKMFSSYHYLKQIEEKNVYQYLLERFGKKRLEFECQNIDFESRIRKSVDVSPALKVYKETGDISKTLDVLYQLRSQKT